MTEEYDNKDNDENRRLLLETNVLEQIDGLIDFIDNSSQFTDIHRIDNIQQSFISGKITTNIHAVQISGINNIEKQLLQNAINQIHYKYKQLQSVIIVNISKILNDYIGIPKKQLLPFNILFYDSLNLDEAFDKELEKEFNIFDHTQPLYRICITKDEYVLFTSHHTLFDGRSRIPFWRDFLMLINNGKNNQFDNKVIKNGAFCESLLKDCFIKNNKMHNQFRYELYKYFGDTYKFVDDIKLNKNNIIENLDGYFSDKSTVSEMINLFKMFGLIESNDSDQFISITNPKHIKYECKSNAIHTKRVYGSIDIIYNTNLVKLCKKYGTRYSVTFAYIMLYSGIKNMFKEKDEINNLHNKMLLNSNVLDQRFLFDEKKMKQYFGDDINSMDIMGNYVATHPNIFKFDVNLKIGSKEWWLKMKEASNEISSTKNLEHKINADMFYGKEMEKCIEMSKLKSTLFSALTSLGCIDLNDNNYKYKIKKYYRAANGLEYYGGYYVFGTAVKDVGSYDLMLSYHEMYITKDDASNIINDIVGIIEDLYNNEKLI